MPRRMIDSAIWGNEKFAALPMGAQLLQIAMINHADDQGRVKGHPVFLLRTAFPYSEEISAKDIREWLELLHNNGTIILYEVDGKQYAQMVNWWKYQSLQYAQPSEYPRPPEWRDRIRRTLTKGVIITCNWLKINGEPISDTCDQDGNPLPKSNNGKPPKPAPEQPDQPPDEPCAQHDDADDHSGDYSPESTGERTTKLNLTQFNLTKDHEGEKDLDGINAAGQSPEAESIPPAQDDNRPGYESDWQSAKTTAAISKPVVPSQKTTSTTKLHRVSAIRQGEKGLYDPRKLKDKRVAAGAGTTPCEVLFEFVPYDPERMSVSILERVHFEATDLVKWRQILTEIDGRGWRLSNVADRLKVYHDGFQHQRTGKITAEKAANTNVAYSLAGLL